MAGITRSERLANGTLEVWTHEDGNLRLTWLPDRGVAGYPGHTFSPDDEGLAEDFPRTGGAADLMAWGRKQRFGEA